MPITFVQSSGRDITTSHSVITTNFPVSSSAGNLLTASLAWRSATVTVSAVTDNAANSYTSAAGPVTNKFRSQMFYVGNASLGATILSAAFSVAVTQSAIVMVEYSGAAGLSVLDVISVSSGNTNAINTSNVTPNQDDEMWVCMVGKVDDTTGLTPGAGYTERQDIGGRVAVEDSAMSVIVTNSGRWTTAGGPDWQCILATFKAATAAPAVTAAAIDESYTMTAF